MLAALRRTVRDQVVNLGLSGPATRVYRAMSASDPRNAIANARYRRDGAPDGLPIPPADLRFSVAGTTSISWFLRGGELGFESIEGALARNGVSARDLGAVLDFGCGCGRVLRRWASVEGPKAHGCDYDPRLVEWCRGHLPFAAVSLNQLSPPLPYPDSEFDLVYALSVFTHLTRDLQTSWMAELSRVVRPGGYVVLTTHGDAYLHRLNRVERDRYLAGDVVVKNNVNAPGSISCTAYHPAAYVREHMAAGLELVEFIPEGARGNPRQDLYLLRKPA